jgi:hypothetical protein
MGRYYNPPEDVTEGRIGRRLTMSDEHIAALGQLADGEHLYMGLDTGTFWVVGCVDHTRDFEFMGQGALGAAEVHLYALPEDAHQKTATSG